MKTLKVVELTKKHIDIAVILAIFLSAFTFYISAIDGDFVFDDLPLISSDPFYHPGSGTVIFDCFTRTWWRKEFSQGLYRPLTIMTYLLNAKISGLNSESFRFTNIILHSILSAMLYILFLAFSNDRRISFLAAILFAIHPIHSEAVIPASGRADLLASLFLVLGMIFHISKSPFRIVFIFMCSLFAALSKEFGVLLLPLCLLYDIIFRSCEFRKNLSVLKNPLFIFYYVSFISILVYFGMRIFLVNQPFPEFSSAHFWSDNHLGLLSFWGRQPTALWLQVYALWKFIYPAHLSHDYSYAQIIPIRSLVDPRNSQTIICLIIILTLLYFLIVAKQRALLFSLLAYFIAILPTANIIVPTGTIFGERLFYFPTIFLSFFMVGLFSLTIEKKIISRKIAAIFAFVIFISFFMRLSLRIADFHDQYSLAKAGVLSSPKSFKMWNNYALQLYDRRLYLEAEAGFNRSLEINPSNFQAIRNRANTRLYLGKNKEALNDFLQCIKMGTQDPQVFNKAGALFAIEGNNEKAIECWEMSLRINNDQPDISKALSELKEESE